MNKIKVIKTVDNFEREYKYSVSLGGGIPLAEREFIIYQWYFPLDDGKEVKIKLVLDFVTLTEKWVRVSKKRVSHFEAEKKIEYLDPETIDISGFIGMPFVCKRRSIFGGIHLDRFVISNQRCKYLLENEGEDKDIEDFCRRLSIEVERDVSADFGFRNINLCTVFSGYHAKNLYFMLDVLH